jgi:hypothetical protein
MTISVDYSREKIEADFENLQSQYELQLQYNQYKQRVFDAGFGEDEEAYEASWNRTFEYAQSGAINDLLENNA